MLNGVMGAMSLIFDPEYIDDEQFFREPARYAHTIAKEEWGVLLNYRAYVKELECIVPDCDEPIWAVDAEVIPGYNREKSIGLCRLLVTYRCSSNHKHVYEAIPLYTKEYL